MRSKRNERNGTWTHIKPNSRLSGALSLQQPHPVAAHDLDVITNFSESLSRHLSVFRKNIQDDVSGLHREQLSEMREMHETFAGTVMSEIQDIKAVMESLVSRSSGPSPGKTAP